LFVNITWLLFLSKYENACLGISKSCDTFLLVFLVNLG
jgi:hypothetical protein